MATRSREGNLDRFAAVVPVVTTALQTPSLSDTAGLARAVFIVGPTGVPIIPDGAASATGTTTSVAGSASAVTILAANTNRLGATISNDSTAILYLLLGTGTASATNYTVALDQKGSVAAYFEVPFDYTGIITGIWASAVGSARVTEFT
jgi:hypothetical protein